MFKPRNLPTLPANLQEQKSKVIAQLGASNYAELCKEFNELLISRGFSVQALGLSGK